MMAVNVDKLVGVKLRSHDLQRQSATYASVFGSAYRSRTQRYLKTIGGVEAIG
jgi:hypothetical protein